MPPDRPLSCALRCIAGAAFVVLMAELAPNSELTLTSPRTAKRISVQPIRRLGAQRHSGPSAPQRNADKARLLPRRAQWSVDHRHHQLFDFFIAAAVGGFVLLLGAFNRRQSFATAGATGIVPFADSELPRPSTPPIAPRSRRQATRRMAATPLLLGLFQDLFGGRAAAAAPTSSSPRPSGGGGPTNQVVAEVDGIRQKRLGGGDIIVSELGLGTQRWGSADFNAPDEAQCHRFLDRAVLGSGVNLVDTAEQYPIPSDLRRPEGLTEEIIGRWHKQEKGRREKLVIATKITGGRNVTRANIVKDCEASLKRLQTDYIDVYLLHWPARYTPQANWGQSLMYHHEIERSPYYRDHASFEDICLGMDDLIKAGKIRGWGICNDNAFGLTKSSEVARRLGVAGPVAMQNDFSLNDRRAEENGVTEASSPIHENVGFMAYNALGGGILTGKYLTGPGPASIEGFRRPRGRFDETGWGRTLYRYYSAPALRSARVYERIAKEAGISLTELSLRWCRERQGLTTVLVGHTSVEQLNESIRHFQNRKALPESVLAAIDIQHMRNRLPIFSSEAAFEDWDGTGDIGELIP